MYGEKPIVSFRIRSDIKEALQDLANRDRRSLSSYIELALEAHIEAKKEANREKKMKVVDTERNAQ
jgi:predicted transcriptional regulator